MSEEKILRKSPRNLKAGNFEDPNLSDSSSSPKNKKQKVEHSFRKCSSSDTVSFFVGDPIPDEEARKRWPWRYEDKGRKKKGGRLIDDDDDDDKMVLDVKYHYAQADIDKCVFNHGDCPHVKVRWKGYSPSEDRWEPIDGLRYRQIGNAVAVAVSRALGYALGIACLNQSTDQPLMI